MGKLRISQLIRKELLIILVRNRNRIWMSCNWQISRTKIVEIINKAASLTRHIICKTFQKHVWSICWNQLHNTGSLPFITTLINYPISKGFKLNIKRIVKAIILKFSKNTGLQLKSWKGWNILTNKEKWTSTKTKLRRLWGKWNHTSKWIRRSKCDKQENITIKKYKS